jgi:hypothetical protein
MPAFLLPFLSISVCLSPSVSLSHSPICPACFDTVWKAVRANSASTFLSILFPNDHFRPFDFVSLIRISYTEHATGSEWEGGEGLA